ncbi:hypothetical protein CMV_012281 [Castanea mollissima]|uniref:Uncharacterized protein n=1 Tax=Castanea mollissima TaxID=60419 RepID=A0A8J4VJ87_9ROSI|nr:hypothetical protein CMV_012281 [Castanea mollissima]
MDRRIYHADHLSLCTSFLTFTSDMVCSTTGGLYKGGKSSGGSSTIYPNIHCGNENKEIWTCPLVHVQPPSNFFLVALTRCTY